MGLFYKAFVSIVMMLLNVFTFPFFGNFSEQYMTVKDRETIQLNFAAISDTHIMEDWFRVETLRCGLYDMNYAKDRLDALVITGDITDHGTVKQYENVLKAFNTYDPADEIILAVGNHDTWTDENDAYAPAKENFLKYNEILTGRVLEECYYSTEVNGYSFIVMASEDTHTDAFISDTQLNWLRSEMDKAAQKDLPIFVISHWPLNQTHGLPESWGEGDEDPDIGGFGDQSDEIEAILKDYENVFLISGHIHTGFINERQKDLVGYASVESDGSFHSVNLPTYMNMQIRGRVANGTGYTFEVYEDEVILRARSFCAGVWYTDYDVTIDLV